MPFYDSETIERVRQVDLFTYLQSCEPQELVHVSGNVYCTREHDSLRISNGKWCWFSRGIGGYSALDYLIKVKGCSFMEAMEAVTAGTAIAPTSHAFIPREEPPKHLLLPQAAPDNRAMLDYLRAVSYTHLGLLSAWKKKGEQTPAQTGRAALRCGQSS